MEQKRGLIIERTGRKVTALTRSGEFVTFRSSRDDLIPGMEMIVPEPATIPAVTWRRVVPALALSIVVLLVSFFGYRQYLYAQPLMAYLTLDGAGSIELEVNKAGLVKAATPIDEAGSQALAKVDYLNKPAEKVVSALLQLPGAKESSEVVVAVIPVQEDPGVDRLQKKVVEKAEKPAEDPKAEPRTVTAFRLDAETRESAKKLGISAGRAALWALSRQAAETSHGQGQETPPPVEPGKGGQPEVRTETGQGQGRTSILDAVKESLPKVSQNEVKEKEKSLKDITKEWVDKITEELRKEEESRKGPSEPGAKKEGQGSGERSGERSGEGKEESPGTGSKGGTKGTSQAIPPSAAKHRFAGNSPITVECHC